MRPARWIVARVIQDRELLLDLLKVPILIADPELVQHAFDLFQIIIGWRFENQNTSLDESGIAVGIFVSQIIGPIIPVLIALIGDGSAIEGRIVNSNYGAGVCRRALSGGLKLVDI